MRRLATLSLVLVLLAPALAHAKDPPKPAPVGVTQAEFNSRLAKLEQSLGGRIGRVEQGLERVEANLADLRAEVQAWHAAPAAHRAPAPQVVYAPAPYAPQPAFGVESLAAQTQGFLALQMQVKLMRSLVNDIDPPKPDPIVSPWVAGLIGFVASKVLSVSVGCFGVC